MKIIFSFAVLAWVFLTGCNATSSAVNTSHESQTMPQELIVLAPPLDGDKYYSDVSEDIFNFHIAYAKQILKYDRVLILAGNDYYDDYVRELGSEHVINQSMEDIWMRDFTLSNAVAPVMFRYTSEGQGGGHKGQKNSDSVQESFAALLESAGVKFKETDLLNDGGNYVDDYAGNVVLSRKFLRDNALSEKVGRKAIQTLTGAKNIAFIESDEQGGLEHADGVVAFIGENTLVMNSYPEDPVYSETLKSDLKRGLPGVSIHEIVTPYDGTQIYDQRFGSACGLYTNMLMTPTRIYFPQFGIPEDTQALAQLKQWTNEEIVPVMSNQVCSMGGGVRCMSWQTRGMPAQALIAYAAKRQDRN